MTFQRTVLALMPMSYKIKSELCLKAVLWEIKELTSGKTGSSNKGKQRCAVQFYKEGCIDDVLLQTTDSNLIEQMKMLSKPTVAVTEIMSFKVCT